MKDFFNKLWVQIVAWAFVIIGTLVLLLGGTSVVDISKVPEYVFGIVEAIGILIIFIKKLLRKKDTTNNIEAEGLSDFLKRQQTYNDGTRLLEREN